MLTLVTNKVRAECLIAQLSLDNIRTFSYVRLVCLRECYVGIAVLVRSTEALRGHGKDTTPATIEWSAAAGLPIFASHYKLVASVGSLPP